MTSSLVGSEMCIRDRSGEVSAERFRTFDGVSDDHVVASRTEHGNRNRDAVSYTHLTLPTICSV
eukprot:5720145-Prorocentrum_lima.AAC.1